MRSRRLSLLLVLAFAACDAGTPTSTAVEAPTSAARKGPSGERSRPRLIQCVIPDVTTTTAMIVTPLGGVVALGSNQIQIPAGAVLQPTLIQITRPASPYVEVSIRADGLEHFVFEVPVLVTISYARCARSFNRPLQAWHIDEVTKALLENMGGVDNKLTRTVTFSTGHLSGYAIAE